MCSLTKMIRHQNYISGTISVNFIRQLLVTIDSASAETFLEKKQHIRKTTKYLAYLCIVKQKKLQMDSGNSPHASLT